MLAEIMKTVAVELVKMLVLPAVTSVVSRATTGNWLSWYQAMPQWARQIMFAAFAVWVLVAVVRMRNVQLRKAVDDAMPTVAVGSLWGWVDLFVLPYAGVMWKVRRPQMPPLSYEPWRPDDVEVQTPPRCPSCGTELKEYYDFLRFAVWKRPSCQWHERHTLSFYHVAEDASKDARRKVERKLSNTGRE